MIKIVCDSISDLPENIINKYDLTVVPITINFNGTEYLDGVDIKNDEFYKLLRNSNTTPKTSQATYMQFKDVFEKLTSNGDQVLYISCSSVASGTYQSAVLAKNDMESAQIEIFDSMNVSIGSALFVIKACVMAEKGYTLEEILHNLNLSKGCEQVFFSVGTLEYLQKGGRISSTKATIGNLLNIKPILEVKDGLVSQKTQIRGQKNAYSAIIDILSKEIGNNFTSKTVIVGCGDNTESLDILKSQLLKNYPDITDIYTVQVGAGVCAHSGPEIIGISCL